MGEEFSLDPNQVQPPQEGEATHIEVTSHEGDAQLGEVALSTDNPQPETHNESKDWNSDREARGGLTDQETRAISDKEMEEETGIYHSEHDEADDDEDDDPPRPVPSDPKDPYIQLTAEEKQKRPVRIHNKDKAEAMAYTQDARGHYDYKPDGGAWHRNANRDMIESDVQKAGDEYEVQTIAERDGKTPEKVRELLKSNREALVKYGGAIVENQIKYGEKLSPNLEIFQTISELADKYPTFMRDGIIENDDIELSVKHDSGWGGRLRIKVSHSYADDGEPRDEEWTAGPFNSGRRISGQYKNTSFSRTDEFDSVMTVKQRYLQEEDAARLKALVTAAELREYVDPNEQDGYDPYYDEPNEDELAGVTNEHPSLSDGTSNSAMEASYGSNLNAARQAGDYTG